ALVQQGKNPPQRRRKSIRVEPRLAEEASRLLAAGEYRAAVVSAVAYLESYFRVTLRPGHGPSGGVRPLGELAHLARERGLITVEQSQMIRRWIRVRNRVVHSWRDVEKIEAEEIVRGVLTIVTKNR